MCAVKTVTIHESLLTVLLSKLTCLEMVSDTLPWPYSLAHLHLYAERSFVTAFGQRVLTIDPLGEVLHLQDWQKEREE